MSKEISKPTQALLNIFSSVISDEDEFKEILRSNLCEIKELVRGMNDIPTPNTLSRFAITFSQTVESTSANREGSLLSTDDLHEGFSVEELREALSNIQEEFPEARASMYDLQSVLPKKFRTESTAASVLYIENGVELLGLSPDALLEEQELKAVYDTKHYSVRFDKTLNKQARLNSLFADESRDATADYKRCSVNAFSDLPILNLLRERLPLLLGEKSSLLYAEGNHYFFKLKKGKKPTKADSHSGIGFHGDEERDMVICVSLGVPTTLYFNWRKPKSSDHNDRTQVAIPVIHGSIYVMSTKATGQDWKKRGAWRLVHAAGSRKYTHPKKKVKKVVS